MFYSETLTAISFVCRKFDQVNIRRLDSKQALFWQTAVLFDLLFVHSLSLDFYHLLLKSTFWVSH